MKKTVAALLILTFIPILSGCSENNDEVSVNLGEEAILKPGQTLSIDNEDIMIRFIGVTADSRCPKGATCVWEGEATCAIEITADGVTSSETLVQSGAHESSEKVIDRYTLRFKLNPYPELDREITASEYRLTVIIEDK